MKVFSLKKMIDNVFKLVSA